MKIKIIFLAGLLIFGLISVSSQKNDKSAAVENALAANEQMAWKNLVDKKFDDFAKLFADDYQGVYDFSTETKSSEVSLVKQMTFKSADVTEIKVRFLDSKNAIVTSNVNVDMTAPDGQNVGGNYRATSFWVKRGNQWLIVYHSHFLIKK